jgi:hypothetical protein
MKAEDIVKKYVEVIPPAEKRAIMPPAKADKSGVKKP